MASLDPQAPVPLLIAGQRDAGLRAQPVSTGDFLSVTVEDAFRVETLRSDARPVDLGEVPADALLELTLTDGLTIYATAGQLREDQQRGALRTGGDGAPSDALVVGPRLQLGSPTRSLASIGVKALRLLGIDLSGDLAEASALLVAERIEGKLDPQAGLYRTPTLDAVRQPATAGDFSTSDPALLFLHGTATNTFGSFGSLTEEGFAGSWRRLQQAYGDRIFAFEHRTLTQSPVRNALDLVEQLPARARLHLVSQSRGGLVGELLTRGHLVDAGLGTPRAPFDERDLRLFQEDEARAQELKDLHALNALLQDKQIQIERFVRVACPAGGTTLASRRLDRFFSTLVNLVGLIPVLRVNPVYQYVTALALAIIKKRTEPDALPGLEAMMPGSPLVRVLNNPAARVQAASALTVLAGDVKGSGLLGSLKVWAANRFYRGDHDYVVNTRSMYGGAPREGEATYFFDRHKSVTHFHYFQNERTRTALTQGVLGETTEDAGFRPLTERRRDEADEIKRSVEVVTRKGPRRPRPVVFVLPGIMGSHLSVGRDRIWLDFLDLARGGLRKLNIDAASVQPDGLVRLAYRKLVRYLKRSHHVEQMSYDWRRSVRDAAADLAQRVEAQLAATDLPVRLLAHSMGGLVARAFQLDHPEVWAKLTAREGGRLLMLGTPNGGSFVVRDILLGRARTIKMLGLLDLGSRRQTLINLVKAYPGLLELLPLDDTHDYYADALWDELDAFDPKARPAADALAAAREVRSALAALPFDAEHTYYVAGIDDATPIHHEVEGGDLKFWSTAEGDGRVPWASGIPQALIEAKHVWYMNAAHGKMADHRRSFKALRELLERGATTRLAQTPPRLRAEAVRFEAPEEEVDVFPTADTLAAAVLGFEPTPEDEPMAAARVQVRVTHGDLAYARHPVVIGHHQGDGIVSAEGQLDRYLDGRLTELHRMDLYPGAVGTAEVVLDDRFVHPPGGVIVGLGPFGELTQGHLADSYTQGVLRLAVERANHARAHEAPSADETEDTAAVRANGLSTILVGSGFGGLTLRESIRAILRGVERANERLRQFESEIPAITHVEIIELFEDRAIQAQRVVLDLARRAGAAFEAESPHLQRTRGARRVLGEQDESSWWHRLRVVAERDHERGGRRLVYTSLTARARAEVESQPLDHRLVRLVVDQASQHATWHPQEAEAIFQLLLPSRFKDLLADRPNLLWIVDNTTAAYPWELMHTPSLGEARPLAVQAGMLRQLQVVNPRGVGAPGPAPKVFIVADPKSAFAPLPAAQEEGRQVEALFRERRYTVSPPLIHSKALPIVSRLLVESYQVLHLAGHGVVNYRPDDAKPDEPPVTGMVLDGAFLTPPLIDQMEYVPDLVFLNCCYLGRAEAEHEALWRQRYQLAANLGMQFIRKGARAVVAAGWAIQDDAAQAFAAEFYTQMLAGVPFGEAVRTARAQIYAQYPETNTWGAYQCYGDPYYRLRKQHGATGSWPFAYVDADEAVVELFNLTQRAETAATRQVDALRGELQGIVDALPGAWLEQGRIVEALARAYEALDDLGEAHRYYADLAALADASHTVEAHARRLRVQMRLGARAFAGRDPEMPLDKDRYAEALKLVDAGIEQVDDLLALQRRPAWWALRGGGAKARARLEVQRHEGIGALRRFLRDGAESYRNAYLGTRAQTQTHDHHPLLNWYMLDAVRYWYGEDPVPEFAGETDDLDRRQQRIEAALLEAQAREAEQPSFWYLSIDAVVALLALLAPDAQDLEHLERRIVEAYRQAWRRGGSFRERRSVEDQFAFLIEILGLKTTATRDRQAGREALALRLTDLRDACLDVME